MQIQSAGDLPQCVRVLYSSQLFQAHVFTCGVTKLTNVLETPSRSTKREHVVEGHQCQVLTSVSLRASIGSVGLRPHLCLTIEKTFCMFNTLFDETWRWCGQYLSWPSASECPLERHAPLYLQTLQDSSGVPDLFLSRQVSLYIRPIEHLFAILRTRRCVVIGISCVKFP